jgi:hypothetical protein
MNEIYLHLIFVLYSLNFFYLHITIKQTKRFHLCFSIFFSKTKKNRQMTKIVHLFDHVVKSNKTNKTKNTNKKILFDFNRRRKIFLFEFK